MTDEGYNGYTNYETWLVCLNIDNDEGLYNDIRRVAKGVTKDMEMYELGTEIREYLEEWFYDDKNHIYKICDSWTERDWKEINWTEVAETRL